MREIRNFVAVAERMNVSVAAKEVNLSQPALSRQIQSLEKKLGVSLFERIGKRILLTAEGEEFLGHAAELLDKAQELINRAHGMEKGHSGLLRVGASPQTIAWLISPAMAEFREIRPNVKLIVSEGHNDELVEMIEHGAVHISIACLGINNVLVGKKLFTAQLYAVLPLGHPLEQRKTITISEIASDILLILSRGFLTRHIFDQTCAAHGIRPKILLESDSTHTLISLAKDGHGIAIVSSSAGDTAGRTRTIPIVSDLCRTEAEVAAIWNPNRYRPASLGTFVEILAKHSGAAFGG
nr:LysR family transcriptional regulator [Sneathiella litorea]